MVPRRHWLKPSPAKEEDHLPQRPATRLFVPAGLAVGASVALGPAEAHRLRNVLRLGPSALVAAFNAEDGEWLARIEDPGRGRPGLSVIEQRRPPAPEADIWLLFAPIKRARLDWLVEKATELGATALIPVLTARTQPERVNSERLAAIAVAAAEQSERLTVPEIRPLAPLDRVLADWPAARRLILCDESGAGLPIAVALAELPASAPVALLVGPEGGFTERDLDACGKLSIVTRIGLGPRVLRAETAALAALAVFQAFAGDGRRVRQR